MPRLFNRYSKSECTREDVQQATCGQQQVVNGKLQVYDMLLLSSRKYVGKQLGQELTPLLREVVKKFDASLGGDYSPDAESAAKRTLKNRALQMLASTGDTAVSKELLTRFREATNMTDTIAALTALIDSEGKSLPQESKIEEYSATKL